MKRVMDQLQQAPWLWSRQAQTWLWVCLCAVSCLGMGVWQGEGDAAVKLQAQQAQHQKNLHTIQNLQNNIQTHEETIARVDQVAAPSTSGSLPQVMQHLKASAMALGVQLPVMAVQHTVDPLQLQFVAHGRYADVWVWWQQAQAHVSALVLQRVTLQNEDDRVQMTGAWLWSPIGAVATDLQVTKPHSRASQHIGFDHAAWRHAQRWQAQQSPSYVQWVTPELNRKPQLLEQFDLQRLRYEGVIASASKQRALVRVLDASTSTHPLVMLEEGAYVGQDFGRLQAITPTHLLVREVVRDAKGEWSPRWVKLPLGRTLDTVASTKSAS